MHIKSVKMNVSKNEKMRLFLMSKGSQEIRLLGQKICSVAHLRTDGHESDYCGHPFRVSGVFPSTYHQGSAQQQQYFSWEVLEKQSSIHLRWLWWLSIWLWRVACVIWPTNLVWISFKTETRGILERNMLDILSSPANIIHNMCYLSLDRYAIDHQVCKHSCHNNANAINQSLDHAPTALPSHLSSLYQPHVSWL